MKKEHRRGVPSVGLVKVVAMTHQGLHRDENQDRVVVGGLVAASRNLEPVVVDLKPPSLVAVIDGMGGHTDGSIAAAIAADVVASGHSQIHTAADIEKLVSLANEEIYAAMQSTPGLAGMGATIAGVALTDDEMVVFNVGDARVYLEAGRHLIQATIDDRSHGSVLGGITQSLGGLKVFARVDVHLARESLDPGRVLLASDGVFDMISHESLSRAVRTGSLIEAARRMVGEALKAGGSDNISLALLEIPDPQ